MEIKTKTDLAKALKTAKAIYIQVRFGCSEDWIRITKREATTFVENNMGTDADNPTPEDCSMYAGYFGIINENCELYLG